MKINLENSAYSTFKLDEQKLGEAECQNCGKMVQIILPFYGCVFCVDCQGESYVTADASEFKPRISYTK